MDVEYKFFKKIKPDTYIWCTSLLASIKFEGEAWIGVVSEHTTVFTGDKKVFYGNIFLNNIAWSLTNNNIEFEVWEETQTDGERYYNVQDIPRNSLIYYK